MTESMFSPRIVTCAERVSALLRERFAEINQVSERNTQKVLQAFSKHRVSDSLFSGTTGYGYDDRGREVLDDIFADIFGAEKGLVRIGFVNGTHAIASALYAATAPGDTLLAVTGLPYDTLQSVIGLTGHYPGTLRSYGVRYEQVDLTEDGKPDYDGIRAALQNKTVRAVAIQRSRGYSVREALTVSEIGAICALVHEIDPQIAVVVDNCYGEFTDVLEPTDVGADLMAGSLIKNPGGGLAPTGGYVVGRSALVEAAAMRLTVPGIGGECGATLGNNRLLYQGLFMAPHTVAQALKTAAFCAGMMQELGYRTYPGLTERRSDIIQVVEFGEPEALQKFCRGIQAGAPVDSFVTPEPWMMPGYEDPVIMAAGAFVQGASIELSADGPMRPPYCAFLQGGLTYESGKYGVMLAAEMLTKE